MQAGLSNNIMFLLKYAFVLHFNLDVFLENNKATMHMSHTCTSHRLYSDTNDIHTVS